MIDGEVVAGVCFYFDHAGGEAGACPALCLSVECDDASGLFAPAVVVRGTAAAGAGVLPFQVAAVAAWCSWSLWHEVRG